LIKENDPQDLSGRTINLLMQQAILDATKRGIK